MPTSPTTNPTQRVRANLLPDLGLFAASARRGLRRWLGSPGPGFAEELKDSINTLMGYCGLLAGISDMPPDLAEHARQVHGAGQKLKALVDIMAELERIEAGTLLLHEQEIDAAELAEVALRHIHSQLRGTSLTLMLDVPASTVEIRGDIARLRQILITLLEAALANAHRGGSLRLMLDGHPPSSLAFRIEATEAGEGEAGLAYRLAEALAELHGGSILRERHRLNLLLPSGRLLRNRHAILRRPTLGR